MGCLESAVAAELDKSRVGRVFLVRETGIGCWKVLERGGDGGGTAAGRGEGELRRMPRTLGRNKHVTEAANPRIGAAWVPITPKADHV
jgi:hypothetical protein